MVEINRKMMYVLKYYLRKFIHFITLLIKLSDISVLLNCHVVR